MLPVGETYTVDVPGEQYWEDGRIRAGPGGYTVYYDAVDSCWVGAACGGCGLICSSSKARARSEVRHPPPLAGGRESPGGLQQLCAMFFKCMFFRIPLSLSR